MFNGAAGASKLVSRMAKVAERQAVFPTQIESEIEAVATAFTRLDISMQTLRADFLDFDRTWKKAVREQRARDKGQKITKYLSLVPKR